MSVTNIMGRLDMAEKLTIPQLRVAIQNGSLPAYIGIPLLQNKIQMRKRLDQSKNIQEQATPPVAEQVMQESAQYGGIDGLPSGLPIQAPQGMAEGGIVALQAGGGVSDPRKLNPVTGKPYTDAELAAIQARADSWAQPGPLGQAWDVIADYGRSAWDKAQEFAGQYGGKALFDKFVESEKEQAAAQPAPTPAASTPPTPKPDAPADKAPPSTDNQKQIIPPTKNTKGAGIAALPGSQAAVAPETPADIEKPRSALDDYVDMLMKERENAQMSRDDAKNMALIQAGLAIMAGKSPHALANIGEGAQTGLAAYRNAQKEFAETEANRMKQLVSIAGVKEQLGREDRKLDLTERQIAQQGDIAQMRLAAAAARGTGAGGVGGKPMTQAQFIAAVQKASDAIRESNPTISKEDADKLAIQQVRNMMTAMYGGALPENDDPNTVDFMALMGGDE